MTKRKPRPEDVYRFDAFTPGRPFEWPPMSIREHFAGLAMQGLLAADTAFHHPSDRLAIFAVEAADVLIAELSKERT